MRLAYADPPYPGKADRYPENEEVDHVALIASLTKYDGWALSTDERSLAYVLPLCPPKTRVLAWCRPNVAPFPPYPFAAWEPVLCWPARPRHDSVRSYAEITSVGGHMTRENYRGQKPRGFCEWVLRCLGATSDDTLDDLFPGSGIMGATFESFSRQTTLAIPKANHAAGARAEANRLRRTHDPLPGFDRRSSVPEGADFYRKPEAALRAGEPPTESKCYCGYLDWTVEHYGRLTHKHGCPARTDTFCQTHRDGCPVDERVGEPPEETT